MVYSVSQITSQIKEILETTFENITVEGEISNCKPSSTGHLYFTLKEKTSKGEVAISAVMFKWAFVRLGFKPEDGMKVQATGSISVYEARGSYQLVVQRMDLAGEGEILKMLEERKKRLAEEGIFSNPKKPLPSFVSEITVITSPTGAAVKDIIKVAKKRNPKITITILPAVVQGEKATESLIEQLRIANQYQIGQVIIIGRGGGSLEDLLPFSDEMLVREIAKSKIPVISAVGHEVDTSISDLVADVRAATPSEASEIAVPLLSDIILDIEGYRKNIIDTINLKLEHVKLMIKGVSKENLELSFQKIIQPFLMQLDEYKLSLQNTINHILLNTKHRLQIARQTLQLSNPQSILDKGFSVVKNLDGIVVRDASTLKKGDIVIVQPARGSFTSTVEKI